MSFSCRLLRPLVMLLLAALIASAPVRAEFTGADWLGSSADMKKGVVLGTLTVINAEAAFQVADERCASAEPTLLRGLRQMDVAQLQQALERYYQQHPDRRDRAIAHAILAVAEQQIK